MNKNGKDNNEGLSLLRPIMGSNILPSPRGGSGMRDNQNAMFRSIRNPNRIFAVALIILCILCVKDYLSNRASRARNQYHGPTSTVSELHDRLSHEMQEILIKYADNSQRQLDNKIYPPVKTLNIAERKRILVTGGAGFVGSHLVDKLMQQGHEVTVIDNYFTGRKSNVEHWIGHPNFELIRHDVIKPILLEVDQIYHLACPASPPHYQYNPIKTIKTNTMGTLNMLGLARRVKARLLMASTSEIYGDPEEHPQRETYWGHVNPNGPRACYDEGKRVSETMCYAYAQQGGVDVRVARIFNTFGPRMHPHDGRVVSNFIIQAMKNSPITIYGDGSQTRSFQYVEDLVDGMIALMESNYSLPVNLGNPDEYTIREFAEMIRSMVDTKVELKFMPATEDDPKKRRPDITRAQEVLGWKPKWSVQEGIRKTIEYFKNEMEKGHLNSKAFEGNPEYLISDDTPNTE